MRYNGVTYITTAGKVHLGCPDCGHAATELLTAYMGDATRERRLCEQCGQVLFPIRDDHAPLWARIRETLAQDDNARRVIELKRYGASTGLFEFEEFQALRSALVEAEPVLAHVAGWVSRAEVGRRACRAELLEGLARTATPDDVRKSQAFVRARREVIRERNILATERNAKNTAAVMREELLSMMALYVLLLRIEAISGTDGYAEELRQLGERATLIRDVTAKRRKIDVSRVQVLPDALIGPTLAAFEVADRILCGEARRGIDRL